jgi:short-subunit dehydrogenase
MKLLSRGPKLKRLKDQTLVITGASSGIGLSTARLAARRGARVVLSARNEAALREAAGEINMNGGRATFVVADVANPDEVDQIAETARREFGGVDTWVNNAGVSIYGRLTEVPMEDKKKVFDTNFWGVVNGCRTAVREMRNRGGAIINIGSIVSDRAVPLQGIYSASKHAVQGYTDVLRMELEHDEVPISVTLVKPAAIDTPYLEHARNYMDVAPSFPPPVYAPEVAAEAILRCAEKRIREVTVGGGGRAMTALGMLAPRAADVYMERAMFAQQRDSSAEAESKDGLWQSGSEARERGPYDGYVMKSSGYTKAVLSDAWRMVPFIAAGAALLVVNRRKATM